jgi:hypothetical protein
MSTKLKIAICASIIFSLLLASELVIPHVSILPKRNKLILVNGGDIQIDMSGHRSNE